MSHLSARALLFCALAGALAGGCALNVAPVPIEPHLYPALPAGPADRPVLGIGSFADARSRIDRTGLRPSLELRWYGLARQGENRTGDAAFVGSVVDGLRADAAATLARSGAFSSVELVDVDEAGARDGTWSARVDLVLTAEIEAFAGSQEQDSVLSIALAGWLRNRFADPVGGTSLSYRLWDRHGLVLEESVEARHESPGATINQAALDGMAKANERVASRVWKRLVPERDRVQRRVPVRALDACGIGEARVRRLFGEASDVLVREVGVELVPTSQPWRASGAGDDRATALRLAKRERPPADGIVVAFAPVEGGDGRPGADRRFGLADQLGSHAVVGCLSRGAVLPSTIVHEVAHLFGGVHVRDRSSVMHDVLEFDARFLDPLNRRILTAARSRPFGEKLPPEVVRELNAIYSAARGHRELVWVDQIDDAMRAAELRSRPVVGATPHHPTPSASAR